MRSQQNDPDVFLLMEDTFALSQLSGEVRLLFDHATAEAHFGANILFVGTQRCIEHWQIKRDGNPKRNH